MDIQKVRGVRLAGVVACLPENRLDNREDCKTLYSSGLDTLIAATGIEAKYIANPGTSALDLNVAAARKLLRNTQTSPEEIGAVICVTFTPEYLMPADGPAAQAKLNLPRNCIAFDVNMACSGYGYGLYLGALLCRQMGKKVLVLDGDVQTAHVSKMDKATMPILSDAGSASLLSPSEDDCEWHFSFYTNGEQRETLYIKAGGAKNPTKPESLELIERGTDGSRARDIDIFMDGYEVFRFVAIEATKFIKTFMDECAVSDENLDIFVPHQANMYMISQLCKKLKINKEKMWRSGNRYGNPASASIPLTIAENAQMYFKRNSGEKLLLSGFGGGLSVSVGTIALNKDGYYKVIQYNEEETE